jgi:hypothetical protein
VSFNLDMEFGRERTIVIGARAFRGILYSFDREMSVDGLMRTRATFVRWGDGTPIEATTQREIEKSVEPIDRTQRQIDLEDHL